MANPQKYQGRLFQQPPKEKNIMDTENWVLAYEVPALIQGTIAQQVLEANGIESQIVNQQDSSYPTVGCIQIYVQSKDLETARQILEKTKL